MCRGGNFSRTYQISWSEGVVGAESHVKTRREMANKGENVSSSTPADLRYFVHFIYTIYEPDSKRNSAPGSLLRLCATITGRRHVADADGA